MQPAHFNALLKRRDLDNAYQARLAGRVAAAVYDVNRDPKKHRKQITEEDFLPERWRSAQQKDDRPVEEKLLELQQTLMAQQAHGTLRIQD